MIHLPTVTLCCVDSSHPAKGRAALTRCERHIRFADTLLLQPDIKSVHDYSNFVINELHTHVQTDHVLLVQWDGYVLNPNLWEDEWLKYDYIGAPWPTWLIGETPNVVGNGGFSLRSHKLLEVTSGLGLDGSEAEDVAICRTHRHDIELHGCTFAPKEVAERFSFECERPEFPTFGFHGAFNLCKV